MKIWLEWARDNTPLAVVMSAAVLILLGITATNLLAGMPEPKAPAAELLSVPDASRWDQSSPVVTETSAFADRPLFSSTRRIKVAPPAKSVSGEKTESVEATGKLDGWSLLGIFDSGEVEGALIRHSDGKRHRIRLGERIDGWELVDVEPRSIRFTSAKGRSAELDMALATVEVLPIREASKSGSDDATGTDSDNDAPASEKRTEPRKPSFKGYYGGPRTKDD